MPNSASSRPLSRRRPKWFARHRRREFQREGIIMSDKMEIRITANATSASSAFKTVTNDAKAMGTAVEDAGNKSGRSLQQLNQRAAAFGAALGGATLLMGEFS